MSNYLFLDLDHTFLYSHRQHPPDNAIWVEQLNGRPQSWITRSSLQFFMEQKCFEVIPVTTRTHAQYQRLSGIMEQLQWELALIGNGAVLLRNGQEDAKWKDESVRLCEADYHAWQSARTKAGEMFPETDLITMEPFLFYIKNNDPAYVMQSMKDIMDPRHVEIYRDSRKVYCVAKSNSKGNAVKRCLNRYPEEKCMAVAAGDSDFDISMLNAVDIAIYPHELKGKVTAKKQIICSGFFSDDLCEGLRGICRGIETINNDTNS